MDGKSKINNNKDMNMITFTAEDLEFAIQAIKMGITTIDDKIENEYDTYTLEDLCIMYGREYNEEKMNILLQALSKRV